MKMIESSPNGLKTLWEKKKLLVTSNFSFSYSVFKRLVLQTLKKRQLVWERVKNTSKEDIFQTSFVCEMLKPHNSQFLKKVTLIFDLDR